MKLQALIDTLETNIGRADDDNWIALCLQVPEAEELLREMVMLKAACEAVRQYPGVVEYVGTKIIGWMSLLGMERIEMKAIAKLFLGGIEDGEYGEIDIEISHREIEAIQERLVTGSDDVWVQLYALGEATDEMIDAACAAVPGMYRVDAMRAIEAALATLSPNIA